MVSVIQQGLFGDDVVIKSKNKTRGSSFNARIFEQLKNIIKAWKICSTDINDTSLDIEIEKSKMLIKEKEDSLNQRRENGKR